MSLIAGGMPAPKMERRTCCTCKRGYWIAPENPSPFCFSCEVVGPPKPRRNWRKPTIEQPSIERPARTIAGCMHELEPTTFQDSKRRGAA